MYDFNVFIKICFVSLFVWLNYLCSFFLGLKQNLKKKQIPIFILSLVIWSTVLTIGAYTWSSAIAFVLNTTIELGYMCITVYLFAEGAFERNVFIVFVTGKLSSTITAGISYLISPEFFRNLNIVSGGYKELSNWSLLLYALGNVVVVFFVSKWMREVPKESVFWNTIYKVVEYAFLFQLGTEVVGRMMEENVHNTVMQNHAIFQVIGIVFIFVLIILVVVYFKTVQQNKQKIRLQKRLEETKRVYQDSVKAKEKYYALQHEWNRQAQIIRQAKGYIPTGELQKYIASADEQMNVYMQTPQTGNVIVDMILHRYVEHFKEMNCKTEVILSPMTLQNDLDLDLGYMADEILSYMDKHIRDMMWCRVSMMKRNTDIVCTFEGGYKSNRQYLLRKLSTLFGQDMDLRQNLSVTTEIINQRQGAFLYEYSKDYIVISCMLSQ